MFEIKVTDTDVSAGSIPVSWCLDIETVAYLSESKVKEPQVVIITAPKGSKYNSSKESRKVVPLKDLMGYVEFKCAGENTIWAFISTTSAKETKTLYLSKRNGKYLTDALNCDGDGWGYTFEREDAYYDDEGNWHPGKRQPAIGSTLDVDVPAGVFAPEPKQWEKSWVNHFFRDKCVDQCEFRRRRLFAYTVQPVIILAQQVLRLVFTLFALLVGAKGTSLQPLLHPLSIPNTDLLDMLQKGSYFIRSVPGDKLEDPPQSFFAIVRWVVTKFCLVPLMPLVLIPVVLGFIFKPVIAFNVLFTLLTMAVIGIALIFLFGGAGRKALNKVWNLFYVPNDTWYLDQEEITLLTCNSEKKPLTFKTLPAKKRSLKLRFLNLKSKVCRPFSG